MILRRLMKDLVLPVAVAVALAFLIQAAVAKPYQIPTPSMVPTIQAGDRVIANRVIYHFREIDRGDIIVFHPTRAAKVSCGSDPNDGTPFVKRVIGLGGDTVEVIAGQRQVLINGQSFDVPAAAPNDLQGEGKNEQRATFKVPEGKLFVLGDNRQDSCDSHQWTDPFVPTENVIGQAEVTYFPLNHITFLR